MSELGFKQLDADNWLVPDPINSVFVSIDAAGRPRPMTGEDWIEQILRPRLVDSVPLEIKRLFEVARGAMVYGFLFYPVYSLAAEQMFRVTEAAVAAKYKKCGGPPQKNKTRSDSPTFEKMVKWLRDNDIIAEREDNVLDKMREIRNASSHPRDQQIILPGHAVEITSFIAELVNTLFP